jgi:5-methylcytosine-specific restriction endonuclease McrA
MTDNSCPMPRYSSLKRSTKPIRAKKKPLVRVYKSGKVRLTGKKLTNLRWSCWIRDLRTCVECMQPTHFTARFPGDPQAYDMAHIQSRGAGGSDTLDNVVTKCHRCHMQEHTKGLKR